ncbi:MAG: tRNA lysidine(34) synthetase TilS [Bdellovibrionales bacterium]
MLHLPSLSGNIALAVSGGPDSMAMAWLAKEHFGTDSLYAFIVEHGLRAESPKEAATTKKHLEAMGVRTFILPWVHGPLPSRIHVHARKARYDLLIQACKDKGCNALFLAHHKNDQAETILMRLAKGSGLKGLSGIKEQTTRDGITLYRPLLHVGKDELIALCHQKNISYATDKSNDSEKYARGRLRRVKAALETEGLTEDRLLDLGARAKDASEAISFYAQTFIKEQGKPLESSAIILPRDSFEALPRATALEVLSLVLQAIHFKPYPPRRSYLLNALNAPQTVALHGCLIQKSEKRILIAREPAAVTETLEIAPHETIVWDGRFNVTYQGEEKGLIIRALGLRPHKDLAAKAPEILKTIPQGRLRATLPALWKGEEWIGMPSFSCDFGMLFKD